MVVRHFYFFPDQSIWRKLLRVHGGKEWATRLHIEDPSSLFVGKITNRRKFADFMAILCSAVEFLLSVLDMRLTLQWLTSTYGGLRSDNGRRRLVEAQMSRGQMLTQHSPC
ncbi:hypothetical protein TIFTF001_006920 [Ficus carica]|uniref:Uncharacterized protein n=1 Tax=Ficus carica TaxID=3494 RepID=A0AA88A597_FICCA|nr:hypothetical protein TIFTF001_006920 [Ficus carica]